MVVRKQSANGKYFSLNILNKALCIYYKNKIYKLVIYVNVI